MTAGDSAEQDPRDTSGDAFELQLLAQPDTYRDGQSQHDDRVRDTRSKD